ncbi:cytochrome C oxidase subunit IV family protein [Melghirimyces algeriensis]|uniref:Cytochrome c oxidase subunit 4 n=1 Tax=Melghirimyces algeriensis TaxID=910412 RepID=A0A521DVV4_9BACL|nr:cytochrome C oxidase subunit IV family protein [Melghirimyces algeriensis]SMO75827.1 cytochrome c oxidase subunit 4 [Melghirimyces algeriensis]
MEANTQPTQAQTGKQDSGLKYVASFALMILLTAVAFAAVAMNIVPQGWVIPLILVLAAVQVFLQLFTFMHLDLKKDAVTVSFMVTGLFIGVVCAVAVAILV